MIISKIFLDMDGVIADFEKEYESIYFESPLLTREKKGEPEFKERWHNLINSGVFASLDKMPDGDRLLSYLSQFRTPVIILSSSSDYESHQQVQAQKLHWLEKNNIHYPALIVPGKRFKRSYVTKHSLLIDDTEKNVQDWRESGGQAILHVSAEDTIEQMSRYIFKVK